MLSHRSYLPTCCAIALGVFRSEWTTGVSVHDMTCLPGGTLRSPLLESVSVGALAAPAAGAWSCVCRITNSFRPAVVGAAIEGFGHLD